MHGKGAMRCCVPMLHLWIISHIETPRDIFNNFGGWKNLDGKVWIEKYVALLENKFKWKASWMNYTTCIMSCGNKIWVPLIGVTRYDVMLRSHKLITLA